ncbi:MAG: hypothetical protein NDI62_00785 [Burkholderiales bacterium]|nr:hypothetical protein [Burkholderiales bacterium]
MTKFQKRENEIKTLLEKFVESEKKFNETLFSNRWKIISHVKKTENIRLKIEKINKEIFAMFSEEISENKFLVSQIEELRILTKQGFLNSLDRFVQYATSIKDRMLESNMRGDEYSELLEALNKLGINIGEHETYSNSILKKEKRIKSFDGIVKNCKLIRKTVLKYNYILQN